MGPSESKTTAHTTQRQEIANHMDAHDTYNNQHGKNNIDVMDIGAGTVIKLLNLQQVNGQIYVQDLGSAQLI